MKILQILKSFKNCIFRNEDESLTNTGKCTTCRFNDKEWDRCFVGTYWAERGVGTFCYEGELWEAIE